MPIYLSDQRAIARRGESASRDDSWGWSHHRDLWRVCDDQWWPSTWNPVWPFVSTRRLRDISRERTPPVTNQEVVGLSWALRVCMCFTSMEVQPVLCVRSDYNEPDHRAPDPDDWTLDFVSWFMQLILMEVSNMYAALATWIYTRTV